VSDLASLPHAAVVVEDRYSQVYKLERVRPAVVANGLAELQVHFPTVPIVFCETRQLAEEWTYRFLGATLAAEVDRADTDDRIAPAPVRVFNAEIRAWARQRGLDVSARGRIATAIVEAYRAANPDRDDSRLG
jgi:hypothetical protein